MAHEGGTVDLNSHGRLEKQEQGQSAPGVNDTGVVSFLNQGVEVLFAQGLELLGLMTAVVELVNHLGTIVWHLVDSHNLEVVNDTVPNKDGVNLLIEVFAGDWLVVPQSLGEASWLSHR